MALLLLTPGSTYGIIGGFDVTQVRGSTSKETVFLSADAKAVFDPTFNFGVDVFNIAGAAQLYTVRTSGGSILLEAGNGASITIPYGGSVINFADVSYNLQFNAAGSQGAGVYLGGQLVNQFSAPVTPGTGENPVAYVLTVNQDVPGGTALNDTYLGTHLTLQSGDNIQAGAGQDTLRITASADFSASPTLNSVERVEVSAPNVNDPDLVLDLSSSTGVTELVSNRVTDTAGAATGSVAFDDVQDVNGTTIYINDTNLDHFISYDDANAYANSGGNHARIGLNEVDGSGVYLLNERPADESDVDEVTLMSGPSLAGVSTTADNVLSELRVGSDFQTLNVTPGLMGSANLEIEGVLDVNVDTILASTLDADLTLTANTTASNPNFTYDGTAPGETFVYDGAQGVDTFALLRNGNADIALNNDDDDFDFQGNGNLTIDAGAGDDNVTIIGDNTDNIDDGVHDIDLGTGNDSLTIQGLASPVDVDNYNTTVSGDGTTLIDAGTGDDTVTVESTGNYNVTLGSGDDQFRLNSHTTPYEGNNTVDAGAGDDLVSVWNTGTTNANLGSGDDDFFAIGDGNRSVVGDSGDDEIVILGDGNHDVDAGADNDEVWIGYAPTPDYAAALPIHGLSDTTVVGYHDVDLGSGDDFLLINGPRVATGNIDNNLPTLVSTNVTGGDGDDTVVVTEDHYLNVDLGANNDVLDIRAKDLTVDDTAEGGTGSDTLVLRNVDGANVTVGASETINTTGFEVYDLHDANITVVLTDQMITTAEGQDFTVRTQNAVNPQDDLALSPMMTVDMTNITTPAYNFTLDGGTIRDVVIGDDFTINSRSTLLFDSQFDDFSDPNRGGSNNNTGDSFQDTLCVIGGATITAADMRNVIGLDRIELLSDSLTPQTWTIELTDKVIDQATSTNLNEDNGTLTITVGRNVPAGSSLYITLDPSVANALDDVRILTNANVTVYINNVVVTEPQFGTDFSPGLGSIVVLNQLIFTANGDNLVGTGGNDEFYAYSLADIQAADGAEGNGGFDTMYANTPTGNSSLTLEDIFSGANITEIERLEFVQLDSGLKSGGIARAQYNIVFDGLGDGYLAGLQQLATGDGNDDLTSMRDGLRYELNAGNDFLEMGEGEDATTIWGGPGMDTVEGANGDDSTNPNDNLYVHSVEFIDGRNGEDEVTILGIDTDETPGVSDSDAANNLISFLDVETVNGSDLADNIYADSNGGDVSVRGNAGDDTINVGNNTPSDVTVIGGSGNDIINVRATNSAYVEGWFFPDVNGQNDEDTIDVFVTNGNATVHGQDDDDVITVTANTDVSVTGGTGDDDISVITRQSVSADDASVEGGSGNDTIVVQATDDVFISGGTGNDAITATFANDLSSSFISTDVSTIEGGSGNDTITANANGDADVSIDGGADDDTITLNYGGGAGQVGTVDGGSGNDTLNVNTTGGDSTTIIGGSGDDTINLKASAQTDGFDEIMFGNIEYDFAQVQTTNTQGLDRITGFQFEEPAPGDPSPDVEDSLNFTAFLGQVPPANLVVVNSPWNGSTQVNADNAVANAIIVLESNAAITGATFGTGANGGPIKLNDNSRAVVVVKTGATEYDIYFVQDIATGSSQVWAVNKVADLTSATAVGLSEVYDNVLDGQTGFFEFNVGVDSQSYDMNSDADGSVALFGTFLDSDRTGNSISNFISGSGGNELNFVAFPWLTGGVERGGGGSDGGPFSGSIDPFFHNDDPTTLVNITNKIAILNDNGGGGGGLSITAAEIASMFTASGDGDDAWAIDAGGRALVIGEQNGGDTRLWYLEDADSNGEIETAEVHLVTELNPDAFAYHAENFVFFA